MAQISVTWNWLNMTTGILPQQCGGFWLRRHIDGSDEVLWKVALDILEQYDRLASEISGLPNQNSLWVVPVPS